MQPITAIAASAASTSLAFINSRIPEGRFRTTGFHAETPSTAEAQSSFELMYMQVMDFTRRMRSLRRIAEGLIPAANYRFHATAYKTRKLKDFHSDTPSSTDAQSIRTSSTVWAEGVISRKGATNAKSQWGSGSLGSDQTYQLLTLPAFLQEVDTLADVAVDVSAPTVAAGIGFEFHGCAGAA